jgi:hypothetical protein
LNFAKSNATASIAQIAQSLIQGNLGAEVPIPKEIINSMAIQGMQGNSAFSPGQPINPTQPIGSDPRQFEYMIGQNIVQSPRANMPTAFDTIRSIVEAYDIAQMCIEVRQDELRNLDWDIVPADDQDRNASIKYASEIAQVRTFFQKPDGHTIFDDFQNQLSYDWLAYDALTVSIEKTKGGKLGALHAVDGTTITPLIDFYGRMPQAPAPAYVQFIQGLPWAWLDETQIIYRPHRKRNSSVYGFCPIEWLLQNINTDIRYQMYFLQYFTEGSIPDSWINAPEDMKQPGQIKEFQKLYDNVMVGDQSMKQRARFIPFGSKVTQSKDTKFNVDFPTFLFNKSCAAFKVAPSELGFTEKVNKSSGDTQENVQYRRSIRPSAKYFQSIYNGIISNYFNMDMIKFKFLNIDEQEDQLVTAQRDQVYINCGVMSPDEVRAVRLGMNIDPTNPVPRLFVAGTTVMAAQDLLAQSKANLTISEGTKTVPGTTAPNNVKPTAVTPDVAPDDNQTTQKSVQDRFIKPARKNKDLKVK